MRYINRHYLSIYLSRPRPRPRPPRTRPRTWPPRPRTRPRYSQYITSHSLEPHYLKVLMMMQVKKKKTVKRLVLIVQLYVLVALQKYQVCQHLITHSCSMWPHKETAMTEDTFHGCWCCWRAENFLQQVVQDTKAGFLQDSFPWIWRATERKQKPYILCSLTEADKHRKTLHSICLKTSKARTVSGPRPRTWLPRPRPRPRTRQLASRRLEAKDVASRTPSLAIPKISSENMGVWPVNPVKPGKWPLK